MKAGKFGRVITMSPPITAHMDLYKGKTAYFMSKFGMTMVALGAGAEGKGHGITGNALWPATVTQLAAPLGGGGATERVRRCLHGAGRAAPACRPPPHIAAAASPPLPASCHEARAPLLALAFANQIISSLPPGDLT